MTASSPHPVTRLTEARAVRHATRLTRVENAQQAHITQARRTIQAILKVSDACNLSCVYCFDASSRHKGVQMASTTAHHLPRLMDVLLTEYDAVDIVFHGGEPLLATPESLLEIMDLLRPFPVEFHTQTNLCAPSIEKHDRVFDELTGLSFTVDGPMELHDAQRVRRDGSGTHAAVLANLDWIRSRHPSLDLGVLCTLSERTVRSRFELYEFFKGLGVAKLAFNPVFDGERSLSTAGYFQILETLFAAWLADPQPLRIRLFIEALKWLTGIQEEPTTCARGDCVGAIMSVSPAGFLAPCLHWHDDHAFHVSQIADLEPYREHFERKFSCLVQEECRGCELQTFCRGGCTNEYVDGRWFFCEAMKSFMKMVQARVVAQVQAATAPGGSA